MRPSKKKIGEEKIQTTPKVLHFIQQLYSLGCFVYFCCCKLSIT